MPSTAAAKAAPLPSLAVVLLLLLLAAALHRGRATAEDALLKCDESELMPGFESFCTVSSFQVTHSQNVKIQAYARANLTRFMKFYNSVLLYVPPRLFDVFSGLKTLDISQTQLVDVTRNTFAAAGALNFLNMSHNQLEEITTSVFVGAHNLMRLDLSHNRLHTLSEYAFRGLANLNKLILSFNRLQRLPTDLLLDNVYVDSVDLQGNRLELLQPELFGRLRHIRELNVADNRLRHFDPATLRSAYAAEVLLLGRNQLEHFRLANRTVVKRLELDHNQLGELLVNETAVISARHNAIAAVHVHSGRNVEALLLSANRLSDISNITGLAQLKQLDLSHNPIGPLNVSTFSRLAKLTELRLRAAGVRRLSFGMFARLGALELLDLAFNNLTELNLDIFVPNTPHLHTLYVDGNALTEIGGRAASFAQAFPALTELGISRNRFNCSYLHWLLVAPQLREFTRLHIEPDDSVAETTHIRDVTCVSHVREDYERAEQELRSIDELQRVMQQSLATLGLHARQMHVYFVLLKVSFVLLVLAVLVVAAFSYWKLRRPNYFARRGGAIVFRSNATVNTHMEQ